MVGVTEHDDDARAVRDCLAGGREGYALLLARHRDPVYSFLRRLVGDAADAEDLAQETFLKAFRALASYDPARPLRSWLFGIAHHAALDFLRARRPETLSLDDGDGPPLPAAPDASPESEAAAALDGELVERLLRALPAPYREVLLLRHAEDLSVAEVAAALGLPEGTVKVRLFRAREMMRGKWEAFSREENETRRPRDP